MNKIKLFLILGGTGIILLFAAIALVTVGRVIGQFFFGKNFAEGQVKEYVSSVLRQQVNGARCQAMDTDGNGYVSCDYTLMSQPEVTHSIECAAWGLDGFLNRGCKTRFPNLHQ